jgi:Protein of unknown function (DUF5132)
MALLDDILNGGNLVTGVLVGAATLIAWPLIGRIARPLAKNLIKGGLAAYRKGERLYSAVAEDFSDMIAEAEEEMTPTTAPKSRSNPGAPGGGT